MTVINITTDQFNQFVSDNTKVLLDFWAPWCAPCKMMAPIIEEVSGKEGDISIGKINIDEESALANQYRVMSIPTLILLENGEEKKRSVGLISKADLEAFLD